MNRSGWRPRLAALLTALVVSVGLLGLSSLPAWAAAGTITEFPTPTRGTPFDITAGPDGALWFTEDVGNKIGRITTGGSITEFPFTKCRDKYGNTACGTEGITTGSDGNLWFTEFNVGNIVRMTPGGSFTFFHIPTTSSKPEVITSGPDGNLWFTQENGSKIGRITTS